MFANAIGSPRRRGRTAWTLLALLSVLVAGLITADKTGTASAAGVTRRSVCNQLAEFNSNSTATERKEAFARLTAQQRQVLERFEASCRADSKKALKTTIKNETDAPAELAKETKAPPAPKSGKVIEAYVTGYAYGDNDPPSRQIANPGSVHDEAGGTGTYEDPVTLAVAEGKYEPGTRFHLPFVKRYFVVEDTCGSCGEKDVWIDMWIGGDGADTGAEADCEASLTTTTKVEVDPPKGRPVVKGPLYDDGKCFSPTITNAT